MESESDKCFIVQRIDLPAVRIGASNVHEMAENIRKAYGQEYTPKYIYMLEPKYFMKIVTERKFDELQPSDKLLAIFDEEVDFIVKDVNRSLEFKIKKSSYATLIKNIQVAFEKNESPTILLDDEYIMITEQTLDELQPGTALIALFGEQRWMDKETQDLIGNKCSNKISCKKVVWCGIGVGILSIYTILHCLIKQ